MSCGFDHELVSMYADGVLRRDRASQVEGHVDGCNECRSVLLEMRQFEKALTSLPRKRAPHELVDRIVMKAATNDERSAWDTAMWTADAVVKVAMCGFAIDDELEVLLRRESPSWVARWVLFV